MNDSFALMEFMNTLMKYNRPRIAIKIGKCVRFDADALVEAIKNENKKGD